MLEDSVTVAISSWLRSVPPATVRSVTIGVAATLAALAVAQAVILAQIIAAPGDWSFGMDYGYYREVGARWLKDGTYYLPHQLAGPYDVTLMADVLYPPIALLLFVPAAVVPAVLWWAIPIAIVAFAIARWRPRPWAWALMLALLLWPRAMAALAYGNTDMWAMAAVAGGLLWGFPAVLVVLKPTLAPFALLGIRRRSWWVASAGLAAISLVMLPLWSDYVVAMRNLRIGADYSLGSIALLGVPVVAWLGRSTPAAARMPGETETSGARITAGGG